MRDPGIRVVCPGVVTGAVEDNVVAGVPWFRHGEAG